MLNQTAIYCLRALAVLASAAPGESFNAAALAERTGVPRQYLSKIMRKLVIAKLVRSQRGHGGGFQLMRPPAAIRMRDALAAVDLALDGGCAFGFAKCDPVSPCPLHPLWSRLQDSLASWVNSSTFADLGGNPTRPRQRA